MPTREEWAVVALLLGAVAVVGVAVYVLSRKKSARQIQLKRVSQPKVVLTNLERRQILRDGEGNIKEIVIHRELKRVE